MQVHQKITEQLVLPVKVAVVVKKRNPQHVFHGKKTEKLTMDNSNNVAVTTTSDTKMDG